MTKANNHEAILKLERFRDSLDSLSERVLIETCDIAINALTREFSDGCDGCAFTDTEEWEMPCARCRRNSKDYYRATIDRRNRPAMYPVLVSEGHDHRGVELFSLSCPCCGYDFRNTEKKVCPECGISIDWNKEGK
ncbi:MAG: hypothetical protein IJH05_05880 [Firmicutes bacterium]|nr:hypothetical protein [Bacillota bacterium]